MIGDGPTTDMRGAMGEGLDSLFIGTGIHDLGEFGGIPVARGGRSRRPRGPGDLRLPDAALVGRGSLSDGGKAARHAILG